MDTGFRLFPESASTAAQHIDRLYLFLLVVAGFFTLLIFVLIVGFAIKYRRGSTANRTLVMPHARFWLLEVTWSLIPLGLTMIMFGWGAEVYFQLHQPPDDCLEINVVAKQWMWKLQHPDGRQEINTLHVPLGRPVKLRMISEDVIHSFYVPAFRVKQDVLPGRYTTIWFQPTRVGSFRLFCAEYCGTSHSQMTGWVIVQEPAEYSRWLEGAEGENPVVAGKRLYEQFRCGTCHDNPTHPRCPPLDGLYGQMVRLADGKTVKADEAYLRESILNPSAKVVAGYQPLMPSYQGQIGEEGVLRLVAYLVSRKAAASDVRGEAPPKTTGGQP
jgi:cytochrome c oxidase subunit 2